MSHEDPFEDNPFDLLGLDPRMTPQELTEELRQRAERALPEGRARLQGLWRKLTLKETDRLRWALLAHPRGSQRGDGELEELRQKVPPYLSRRRPAPLTVGARDVLVGPQSSQPVPLPVAPPAHFDDTSE